MLFGSFEFVVLVISTLCLYYSPPVSRWQVLILIASSLLFYAYNQADLLWLLILSVSVNIFSSYLVIHGLPDRRRFYAVLGVVINLSILCFFKYGPLISRSCFPVGSELSQLLVSLPLPIGISFFTFQGISLVVDTYRNKDVPQYRSLIVRDLARHAQNVFFFKAFFPQLVSGPIVKAYFFLPQIKTKYWRDIQWDTCFRSLVVGYFLKMVIANNLNDHTALMAYPYFENYSSLTLLGFLFGYSIQIFADFAGYSLIALGLAALFGYKFPVNFNFPYISASFSEFWQRWHISLSSFLREYLYIPLGGNRSGAFRTYRNLLITMVLGGLWHGADWSYAVWGLAHGMALAVERYVDHRFSFKPNPIRTIGRGLLVFTYVTFLWLLFKLPDFSHVVAYCQALIHNTGKPDDERGLILIVIYSLPVIAYHANYLVRSQKQSPDRPSWEFVSYAIMLFLIITNSGSSEAFIYFQF